MNPPNSLFCNLQMPERYVQPRNFCTSSSSSFSMTGGVADAEISHSGLCTVGVLILPAWKTGLSSTRYHGGSTWKGIRRKGGLSIISERIIRQGTVYPQALSWTEPNNVHPPWPIEAWWKKSLWHVHQPKGNNDSLISASVKTALRPWCGLIGGRSQQWTEPLK